MVAEKDGGKQLEQLENKSTKNKSKSNRIEELDQQLLLDYDVI